MIQLRSVWRSFRSREILHSSKKRSGGGGVKWEKGNRLAWSSSCLSEHRCSHLSSMRPWNDDGGPLHAALEHRKCLVDATLAGEGTANGGELEIHAATCFRSAGQWLECDRAPGNGCEHADRERSHCLWERRQRRSWLALEWHPDPVKIAL